MIIDAHCQLGESRVQDFALSVTELGAALDESGIDRACCFSFPDAVDNVAIIEAAADDRRLIPIACVDPNQSNAADQLEDALQRGARGLRLHPYLHGFKLSMTIVDPLFELCARYGVPVLCHGADDVPANNPYQFAQMADRHPGVNLIALYGGFVWNVGDLLDAATRRDNLFLETCAWSPGNLRSAVREVGPEKIVFGSGLPDGDQMVCLARAAVALPDEHERALVLGGNMQRLLAL